MYLLFDECCSGFYLVFLNCSDLVPNMVFDPSLMCKYVMQQRGKWRSISISSLPNILHKLSSHDPLGFPHLPISHHNLLMPPTKTWVFWVAGLWPSTHSIQCSNLFLCIASWSQINKKLQTHSINIQQHKLSNMPSKRLVLLL